MPDSLVAMATSRHKFLAEFEFEIVATREITT